MKPRLLDLFCGAGGCTAGYQRAGFYVIGVDIEPQPNYCGEEFVQADALDVLDLGWLPCCDLADFDAIHASPPCQAFSAYRRRGAGVGAGYSDSIGEVRDFLCATGLPYVIENIPNAPLRDPIRLCGTAFGLEVQRHRLFESNVPIMAPPCAHGRNGRRFTAATNREENSRRTVEIGVWRIPLKVQRRAMGIDWMTLEELSEAIPPVYTEHIGHYLMAEINARQAKAA